METGQRGSLSAKSSPWPSSVTLSAILTGTSHLSDRPAFHVKTEMYFLPEIFPLHVLKRKTTRLCKPTKANKPVQKGLVRIIYQVRATSQ